MWLVDEVGFCLDRGVFGGRFVLRDDDDWDLAYFSFFFPGIDEGRIPFCGHLISYL